MRQSPLCYANFTRNSVYPTITAGTDDKPVFEEAVELVDVGPNLVGRMQRLAPATAERWGRMVDAAAADGVILLIVSGFRSIDYQARLIRKKIDAGQVVSDILHGQCGARLQRTPHGPGRGYRDARDRGR